MPTIYSIGYAALTSAELAAPVRRLNAVLIDVRSRPSGRVKRGFSRADLAALLGERYEHRPEPGGRGDGPTAEGIDRLADETRRVVLVCREEAPGVRHRHSGIALPLLARGIEVLHVYQDQVVTATELQRAIDEDDEYAFTDLADEPTTG